MAKTKEPPANVVTFANPYIRCSACGKPVDGHLYAPGRPEHLASWPCGHHGRVNPCPAWSKLGGCGCPRGEEPHRLTNEDHERKTKPWLYRR